MFTLLYDQVHRVLLARISDVYSSEDMTELDAMLIHFLSLQPRPEEIRAIYDFTDMTALAVPRSRLEDRASRPPIVQRLRILVLRDDGQSGFGSLMRQKQREQFNADVIVVRTFDEALQFLEITRPAFDSLPEG